MLWLELLRTLSLLHDQEFDLAFTVRADIRDNFILWLSNARRRVGYGFGGGAFLLTDNAIPDLEHPHLSVRWLGLLEHVGGFGVVRQPSLQVTAEEDQHAEQCLAAQGVRDGDFWSAFIPVRETRCGNGVTQTLPRLRSVCRRSCRLRSYGFRIPIKKTESFEKGEVLHLALPLRQFMGVLKRCQLLICNDSGPMHIATALGVPVVAIFGPTEPAWFGPLGPNNRVVIQPGFWCRPCFDYCRFDEPYCMRVITVNSVYAAAEETLNVLMQNGRHEETKSISSPSSKVISIAQTV